MDFIKYINTPVGRDAANPLATRIKLTAGRLTGGWIYFPAGPAGLLHFRARVNIHQILPFNPDASINLDDCVAPLHLNLDLVTPPYVIDCVTWNTSTEYDHALTVAFFLNPPKQIAHNIPALKNISLQAEGEEAA